MSAIEGSGSDASLQRAELLERLRVRVDALEANAESGGDLDVAVDGLVEITSWRRRSKPRCNAPARPPMGA